jgi:streptomycin 6-kinase
VTRLQSLWAFVKPTANIGMEGYHHANLHQHVLHHAPMASPSNFTETAAVITTANPLGKHL